jgi:hypothetical protein
MRLVSADQRARSTRRTTRRSAASRIARRRVRAATGVSGAYARLDPRMPAGRAFLAENAPGVPTSRLLAWHDPQPRVDVTPE